MSYLAIGAVTQAVAELLEKKLNKPPLLGSNVTLQVATLPPDDERVERDNGVNLFLYRIAESPFAKNVDWRGDRVTPGLKRPPVALTLHYLLTAYAKKSANAARDDITVHQILGNALAILHEHSVLNDIHDSDFDADLDTQFTPELRNSFDKIKITFAPISMEEFSKIWTGLSKAYRLSVAYEVSLVQIAPIVTTAMPGPPVQQTHLQVATLNAPMIAAVEPAAGPAGGQIAILGSGFRERGRTTSVTVGETTFEEADLSGVTEREILLKLPTAIQRGPDQRITVTVGARESAPAVYRVQPWIKSIQPLRGITGIPVTIPFDLPVGTNVIAEFDGQPVAATPAADRKSVRVIVPAGTANGHKPLALILNDGVERRSNDRLFEVLPSIQSVVLTSNGPPLRTTITVTGLRLKGQNVQIKYGKLVIETGENTNATELAFDIKRSLPPDQQSSVIVDGRESPSWPPSLDRLETAEAVSGTQTTLYGSGLTGQNVAVRFGAVTVNVGPHAYASQITVALPAGLPPGAVQVNAVVNGKETNSLSLKVPA